MVDERDRLIVVLHELVAGGFELVLVDIENGEQSSSSNRSERRAGCLVANSLHQQTCRFSEDISGGLHRTIE